MREEDGEGRDSVESERRKLSGSTKAVFLLHLLLVFYSLCSICAKLAAGQEFMSPSFVLYYGGMIAVLGVYAIGWQQVIKRLPLTFAYANRAVTIVWGIVWGFLFFGETLTAPKLIGAAIVLAGVVLYATSGSSDEEAGKAHGERSGASGEEVLK